MSLPLPFRLVTLIRGLDWCRAVGLLILGIVMVVVFAVGVTKIFIAAFLLVTNTIASSEERSTRAVTDFLKGFEFFFLAPLGLLIFKTLVKYVRVQIGGSEPEGRIAKAREEAEAEVHQLKVLTGSLISAFLVTDLVSKVVITPLERDIWSLGSELAVLVGTIFYVWSLPSPRT